MLFNIQKIKKIKLKLLIISILISFFLAGKSIAKLSGSLTEEAIESRLKPIGEVNVISSSGETLPGANSSSDLKSSSPTASAGPEKIYQDNCRMCHQTGVAGAPKFGNKEDWSKRVEQGLNTMVEKAYNGFNAMPPKGNCLSCTKEQLKETIEYMLKQIKDISLPNN